jgi:hypothetical protein
MGRGIKTLLTKKKKHDLLSNSYGPKIHSSIIENKEEIFSESSNEGFSSSSPRKEGDIKRLSNNNIHIYESETSM